MAKTKSTSPLKGSVKISKPIAFLVVALVATLGVVLVFKSHAGGSGIAPVWQLADRHGKHIYTSSQTEEQKLIASGYSLDSYNGTGLVDWSSIPGCCLVAGVSYAPIYHWQNKQGVNRYFSQQPPKVGGSGYDYSYSNKGLVWYEPVGTDTSSKQVFEYTNGKDFVYIESGSTDIGYFQGKGYKADSWAFNSY